MTSDTWNGVHGGCDWSAGDAHSAAPDPTFAFVGGPCCPTLDFVIAFRIMIAFYTLLTSLFCISYFEMIKNNVVLLHNTNWLKSDQKKKKKIEIQ
jgi:hypothetical protein